MWPIIEGWLRRKEETRFLWKGMTGLMAKYLHCHILVVIIMTSWTMPAKFRK